MCQQIRRRIGITVIIIEDKIGVPEMKSWTTMFTFHFRANSLGKGMNPFLLPPAMGKNSRADWILYPWDGSLGKRLGNLFQKYDSISKTSN